VDIGKCQREGWITEESLEWNEHLGFLRRVERYKHAFICQLYQLYAAAEYSSRYPDELERRLADLQQPDDVTKLVCNLKRELTEYSV
jgi:hypothetical protein